MNSNSLQEFILEAAKTRLSNDLKDLSKELHKFFHLDNKNMPSNLRRGISIIVHLDGKPTHSSPVTLIEATKYNDYSGPGELMQALAEAWLPAYEQVEAKEFYDKVLSCVSKEKFEIQEKEITRISKKVNI